MTVLEQKRISLGGRKPAIHPEAWAADNATIIGSVTLQARASVWYTSVLRADGDTITVGADSNIQDGCVLHADPGSPVVVGERVSVGHRAILHGCHIGDESLIGMGAVVLNGARIGSGCLVAAGAVVLEGATFEPGNLIAGVPAKARRQLTDDERTGIRANSERYLELVRAHQEATR
jgi:carbonic anhydrase/acetyltransferase-like protein (isoleucine patch superfamily)